MFRELLRHKGKTSVKQDVAGKYEKCGKQA